MRRTITFAAITLALTGTVSFALQPPMLPDFVERNQAVEDGFTAVGSEGYDAARGFGWEGHSGYLFAERDSPEVPTYHRSDEVTARTILEERGTLSMARCEEPDTAGGQFFICLTREQCAHLDGAYAAFGRVVEGMDVVDRIRPGDRMLRVMLDSESPHAAAARQAARAARVPE